MVAVTNPSANDALANVVIDRFAGEARRLELFCLGAGALEHVTAAGSIIGHPALDEVVAVAAIDAADPGLDQIEAFSSRGPARVDFPAREDRAKPDLAGFDGVSISNAGGFPACPPFCAFFGTSAASPHTAGVAALLLQKDPSLSPAAVQAALRAGAVDIGAAGFDDASGFGRLDALASAEAVVVPQCAGDDECADDDACTVDACDPVRGCVSTPLAGAEGVACRLGQLASPDVCGPGEIDARTETVIANRVGSALTLLDKASQVSGDARKKVLGKVARQLGALRRRVSRAEAREKIPGDCASTLEDLVDAAQAQVGTLAGPAPARPREDDPGHEQRQHDGRAAPEDPPRSPHPSLLRARRRYRRHHRRQGLGDRRKRHRLRHAEAHDHEITRGHRDHHLPAVARQTERPSGVRRGAARTASAWARG